MSVLWQPMPISLSNICREVIGSLDLQVGPYGGLTLTSYLS